MAARSACGTFATWLGRKRDHPVTDFPSFDALAHFDHFAGVFVPKYVARLKQTRYFDSVQVGRADTASFHLEDQSARIGGWPWNIRKEQGLADFHKLNCFHVIPL
jgi:hypothetical protein